MGKEKGTEGQGSVQAEIQAEWLRQSQEGIWVFSRKEIGEAFSWYKKKRKPKQPTLDELLKGKKRPKHKTVDQLFKGIRDGLRRERYELMFAEILPELVPDERRNPNALSKIESVTVIKLPTPKGEKQLYKVEPLIKQHSQHRPLR
jgi:hypothetical protein